ncbi:MAG: hypothetical protein TH68_00335 [Candidatus Synechococcus spongiarum 142]|uniref:DUF4079 domain-containing protein n=1 Tax=Candidatus Synechococcus spongiarum 142 TaxID=1608213 RepID=A0A6N3XAC1_9SYNE|nr:MAG: hypothetical protein TH68_00335 [Candidatus Synechococcus spongiarum 142]
MPETIGFSLNFVHPLMMWTLLALSSYALFLGIRSKKLRTTKDAELRKQLAKGKVSQRHFRTGSLILALMVLGTFVGMGVTYLNNGKLFVGPHLLTGAAMTCMIALAASLVPLMQGGSTVARKAHVGLNMGVMTLFLWQALTGMEIVNKIWVNR